MSDVLSRARGVLWGQAVGDALGTSVEFQDAAAVRASPPAGWPERIVGGGPFCAAPGQVTDDTELALALARSLVAERGWREDAAASAYVAWRRSDPIDCGQATDTAFGRGLVAGPGVAAAMRARANPRTEANGSLMRSSPLGVFGHALPRASLAALAAEDSRLSHPSAMCQAACAVFVTTVADAVTSGRPGPELFERAVDFCRTSTLAAPALPVLEAAREALPVSDGEHMGWVRIALQHAFFHLRRATAFDAALVETMRCGGDTDTNGAIVGALLGAAQGEAAIPSRWQLTVRSCAPDRPAEYQCGDLRELAEALVGAAA